MEDKELMEDELLVIKGVCDLYLHGALESTTTEVHTAFKDALNTSLDIQNKIYNLMAGIRLMWLNRIKLMLLRLSFRISSK